jgi:hypothetical protein
MNCKINMKLRCECLLLVSTLLIILINMKLRCVLLRDASVIGHVFLLPFYVCPIVSGLSDFGPSVSHTYQLFVA